LRLGKEGTAVQVILNYKSYYEAFKMGVVNNGFKPVAEILFYPLFHSHTLCDANGTPYGVTATNASHWSNGQDPIPKEIQDEAGTKEMLEEMIRYFGEKVIPYELSDALKDEMLDAMEELVQNCDLRDSKKKQILDYYKNGEIAEFLARLFQRALLGNNKVAPTRRKKAASDKNSESLDEFNNLVRAQYKKPKTVVPEKIQPEELTYVSELYKAYAEKTQEEITDASDLLSVGYKEHFEHQRKSYYMAETIHHEIRDSIRPDEEDCFDVLKEEIEDGIYETSHKRHTDAVEKIDAVMERAAVVPISANTENITYNWIGPGEKKGVCHMLVNEERLKWVDDNEQ
jgi:hypothetical protein